MADQPELSPRIQGILEAAGFTPELLPSVEDAALLALPGVGPSSLKAIRLAYPRRPGRPTAYRPEFCERVVELAGDGRGRAEIAFEIGVDRLTLRTWESQHPEFLNAMSRAYDAALAWWEEQGRKGIWEHHKGKRLNANAYRLQMLNRFKADWRDKSELDLGLGDLQGKSLEELQRMAAQWAEKV